LYFNDYHKLASNRCISSGSFKYYLTAYPENSKKSCKDL